MAQQAIIVGAGIGGLAAAIALRKVGFDVQVLEKADELFEIGAGIQISPNASRVLNWLGLEKSLPSFACQPTAHVAVDGVTGEVFFERPLRDVAENRYGAVYWTMHRADLQRALIEKIDDRGILLGSHVVYAHEGSTGVTVTTEAGVTFEGDLLIGADGIKSAVRHVLELPDKPTYTGMTAYRGTIKSTNLPKFALSDASTNWMGPGGHVVIYPLRNGELINIVANLDEEIWTEESWSLEIPKQDLLSKFDGWSPKLLNVLEAIDQPFKWGLYGRQPGSQWGQGRLTLLGDAAHPMVPFLAQGAAMALEDSVVLAGCMAHAGSDLEQGLRRYEDLRRDRAARVQVAALQRAKMLHMAEPKQVIERNREFAQRQSSQDQAYKEFDWIYRYNAVRAGFAADDT